MNDKDFGCCPVCDGSKAKVLSSTKKPFSEFHLVQCKTCGLTRTFPFPTDKSLRVRDIANYYGKGANKFLPILQKIRNGIIRSRAKHYLSIIPDLTQTPKVLDVGCAEGRLLDAFLDRGCECWGIEHSAYPSQKFLNPDRIVYLKGDLSSIPLPEGTYDLIFLWHVLEHLHDPLSVLNCLYNLLSPKGIVVLAVPDFSSLEAKKFRQNWFHLDIPWHKYHFNEKSLKYLIKKAA